jgi:hypothetical protein
VRSDFEWRDRFSKDERTSLRDSLEQIRERISQMLDGPDLWHDFLAGVDPNPSSIRKVRRVICLRALRTELFGHDLFHDPGWDILLDLYGAKLTGERVPVSSACIASRAPATTGLRWLTVLERRALVQREPDPEDSRKVYVSLTDNAVEFMNTFFEAIP